MIYLFLANGFEETEALVPLDMLRRAGIDVLTVGVGGKIIEGSHKIKVSADILENEIDFDNIDGVILPGGMPGTINLENSEIVKKAILAANGEEKLLAAICAAPSILGKMGLLKSKKATCFPSFEQYFNGGTYTANAVEVDGNIITSSGAGNAFLFAFAIIEKLINKSKADMIKDNIQQK